MESAHPLKLLARRAAWLAAGIAIGGLAASWVYAPEPHTPTASPQPPALWGGDGTPPWGQLEVFDIKLEPPTEFVNAATCSTDVPPWHLPGHTRESFRALLEGAKVSPEAQAAFVRASRCGTSDEGCTVEPTVDMLAALSPESRAIVYGKLARFRINAAQHYAFRRRPIDFDHWFDHAGLRPGTHAQIHELLYGAGEFLAFADRPVVCSHLDDPVERLALARALQRVPSLLVKLRVAEGADVGKLVRHWGRGQRREALRALLESIAEAPGGGTVDITHLLPAFARARLFTYPRPGETSNCHWTALNFLSDTPDDRFLDDDVAMQFERTNLVAIERSQARLGDVVLFERADGEIVHAATWIAADVVFSKNGRDARIPWVLTTEEELLAVYFADGGVVPRVYGLPAGSEPLESF